MTPITFKEQTKDLQKPSSISDEECRSLPVFCDGKLCISKWKMSFKERLHCLLRGYVWVSVHSGNSQPPIAINAYKSIFI